MSEPRFCEVLGFNVYKGKLEEIEFHDRKIINTINAYSYVLTKSDHDFKSALVNSDILLPDGFPFVLAAKVLKQQKISKIAGADVFNYLMLQANKYHKKVFFLGASEDTLQRIVRRANFEYPFIRIKTFSPPYKDFFTIDDNSKMIATIREFEPDILFVGMTAPKQEKWVNENKDSISATVICSIGAVFDFYAGTIRRPSQFWINLKLEWLIRLLNEPKRLWKRYLVYSPIFFIDVLKEMVKSFVKFATGWILYIR
jgi:N-acetylglucosaminyldiphosphoundecaprenol N-acetyl-beta-D-mannosaminyltransferase